MFGYMKIYKEELKVKDYRKYQAYYCGLCKRLKEKYGFLGQITLTYDMTFLIILLTSLYEYKSKYMEETCAIHPVKKHPFLWNEATDYGADMNIALCYFHMMDKWEDEKKTSSYLLMGALRKSYKEVGKKYKRQYRVMKGCLNKLRQCEKREEKRIDLAARYFGQLLGELFVYEEDVWEKTLRRMGFYLGKFIYILDAYDDLEKDIINGNYNPLK